MTSLADTLARLRVCRDAGRALPADLIDDAIVHLERIEDAAVMRARRDALIRRAALLLPPGPPYQLATMLAREARALSRTWHVLQTREPKMPYQTVRDCLHAAALRASLPASQRQFYRVLQAANADTAGHGYVSEVA